MPLPDPLLTDKQYVRAKGGKCPSCRDTDLVGDEVNYGNGEATQEMSCGACGASWTDLYKLVGYEYQSDGESEEQTGKDEPDQ